MRSPRRNTPLAVIATLGFGAAVLASCGGKVTFVEGTNGGQGGGGGAAAIDCTAVAFDFDAPITECAKVAGSCAITGTLPDGRALRESCANDNCDLFVDNVKVCVCPSKLIDFGNTCSNGVATCSSWKVDYSDIQSCL